MINQTKHLAIRNISLTYRNESSPLLTPGEIRKYIQSATFLEDVLKFNKTGIFIIEYRTWSYLYCSANVKEIAGIDATDALKYGPQYTLSRIHTDDLVNQEKAHRLSVEIFNTLPGHEKGKHKFAFTFRHNNPDGKEITILQTNIFLKWDDQGRPLVKLILISDISAYKQNADVVFFVSKLNATGKNEIVFQNNFTSGENRVLSFREIEIVNLIATGQSGEKIGSHLGISVNTVKNHKKKIMQKLGCKNSAQLVCLAMLYGLLSVKHSPDNYPKLASA